MHVNYFHRLPVRKAPREFLFELLNAERLLILAGSHATLKTSINDYMLNLPHILIAYKSGTLEFHGKHKAAVQRKKVSWSNQRMDLRHSFIRQ